MLCDSVHSGSGLSGHNDLGLLAIAVDRLGLSDDDCSGAVVVVTRHGLHDGGQHVVGGQVACCSDSYRHPEVDDREELVEEILSMGRPIHIKERLKEFYDLRVADLLA